MEIEITCVGGYNEVGKNMTFLRVDDEAVILDMGFHLPKLIDFEEEGGERKSLGASGMIKMGAIPNDGIIEKHKNIVKAIILGHGHLDHCGGIPYLAGKYKCPVIATPFSLEILKSLYYDENIKIENELKLLNPGGRIKISKNLEIEFITATHSTLQTVMVAIHTKKGTVIYANDFKFDNFPVLGKKPDYAKLKKLGQENVIALIVDSLYADRDGKTPSEKVAREMLKDVMLGTDNTGKAVIVTTFASHIARLKSILEFGKLLDRKVVFIGRSLNKYIKAAENVGLVKFSKEAEIYGYANQIKKKLNKICREGKDKYLIVSTGSQGEPNSILVRMVNNQLPFEFSYEDHVIFSCKTIPADINIANRSMLERKLKQKKVRIFTDIHVSGHASREDLRDLINMTKPQHLIPAHGDSVKLGALAELATEMGYRQGKDVHVMHDDKTLLIEV